ncbi:protein-ER retention protein [Malassezia cuniculi]|uniref:Protein-ER retention protein n=1 Tax=Malassezia cuniculi TaxID=948313 RepID=A0AAF0ERG0_9BASI|nr:protein-ER retention protein [Malassezia cuniculi]
MALKAAPSAVSALAHEPTVTSDVHLCPPVVRVALMAALGLVGFGMDLEVLHSWGLSLWRMLASTNLPEPIAQDASASGTGAAPVLRLAAVHAVWGVFCWVLYRRDTLADGTRTWKAQRWEALALVGLLVLWCFPGPFRTIQRAFWRSLARIATPSLRQHIEFSDVLVADVLTSFAKVFGDLFLAFVVAVDAVHGRTADAHTLWTRRTTVEVPLLTSLPYLIRLRQCLSEYYTHPPPANPRRPLWNALKYASALPVIWLSAWRGQIAPTIRTVLGVDTALALSGVWLVSVLVNTIFSFWWDVTNDWGLEVLKPNSLMAAWDHSRLPAIHRRVDEDEDLELTVRRSSHSRHASVLRAPEKPLPLPPAVYYVLLGVNLLLRFTWSLKMSAHLHYLVEWERQLLLFEALELARRSVWLLLRVEWEHVRRENI